MRYHSGACGVYATGRWPKDRIAALRESIRKWLFVAEAARKAQAKGLLRGPDCGGIGTCALCQVFHDKYTDHGDEACAGCPVHDFTGKSYCGRTPYWDYIDNRTEMDALREARFLMDVLIGELGECDE